MIIFCSKAYSDDPRAVEVLWNDCVGGMYSLEPKLQQLGLGKQVGTSCEILAIIVLLFTLFTVNSTCHCFSNTYFMFNIDHWMYQGLHVGFKLMYQLLIH